MSTILTGGSDERLGKTGVWACHGVHPVDVGGFGTPVAGWFKEKITVKWMI